MIKTTLAIFLSLFLFVSLANAEIKIGILTDLSGPAAYYGQQTRVGAMLAEKELKEQGKDLRLVFEDSALNTQQALSAAQKLIFIDKVDALYVDFTPIAVAVASLAQANKKLMIYAAAAESVAKNNSLAFKTYSNYSQGCEALAREFKKQGIERMGILKAESEYGELCSSGVKMVYPQAFEQGYKQGDTVALQMLSFKNKDVQAVINGSFEGDVINMLQAAKNIKYRVKVGAAEDSFTAQLKDKFKDQLDGTLSFGLQQLSNKVVEKAKKIEGSDLLTSHEGVGLSYVHIRQLYAALGQCKENSADCAAEKLSASAADQTIGFEGWKGRVAQLRTIVKEFRDGKLYNVGSYLSGEKH